MDGSEHLEKAHEHLTRAERLVNGEPDNEAAQAHCQLAQTHAALAMAEEAVNYGMGGCTP